MDNKESKKTVHIKAWLRDNKDSEAIKIVLHSIGFPRIYKEHCLIWIDKAGAEQEYNVWNDDLEEFLIGKGCTVRDVPREDWYGSFCIGGISAWFSSTQRDEDNTPYIDVSVTTNNPEPGEHKERVLKVLTKLGDLGFALQYECKEVLSETRTCKVGDNGQ